MYHSLHFDGAALQSPRKNLLPNFFFGDRFFSVLHLMRIGVKYSSIKFNLQFHCLVELNNWAFMDSEMNTAITVFSLEAGQN